MGARRAKVQQRNEKQARMARGFVVVSSAVLGVGLVAGLFFGMGALEARAATLSRQRLIEVEFAWPPLGDGTGGLTWLPEGVRVDLMDIAYGHLAVDERPLRPDALRSMSLTLMDSGWFESPPAVERLSAARVGVRGTWRVPMAAVRFDGSDYLIARQGERLPLTYPRGGSGQRVLTGIAAPPPEDAHGRPAYGTAWAGEDVRAALDLLRLLRAEPYWGQVAGIDASDFASTRRLAIVTDTGSKVVWGSPVGMRAHGDQPENVKLRRLQSTYQSYGRIDAGRALVEIFGPHMLVSDTIAP